MKPHAPSSAHRARTVLAATAAVSLLPAAARADIVVTATQPTSAIACAANLCAPTAPAAVLNIADLQSMLAAAAVTLTTHGANGIEAGSIRIETPLKWSAQTLGLIARKTIAIFQPVTVDAAGGLSLATNDGGTGGRLRFGRKGYVTFKQSQGTLAIDATPYTLEPDLSSLAAAIAQNPAGHYALPHNYDASAAGTYTASPIPTTLTGTVEGLGNTVSNLTIQTDLQNSFSAGGFFSEIGAGGVIENLDVDRASVSANNGGNVGILVGIVDMGGTISGVSTAGVVSARTSAKTAATTGGIAGLDNGTIEYGTSSARVRGWEVGGIAGKTNDSGALIRTSSATGVVTVSTRGYGGGIVGEFQGGSLTESYSTAVVQNGFQGTIGGLVGELNGGEISNCYASGQITAKGLTEIGGLSGSKGDVASYIESSYASNALEAPADAYVGGVYGIASNNPNDIEDYWNVSISGVKTGTARGDYPGIKGLTTTQLQSELPSGFDPSIWGQQSAINGGLPYLISIPPI